MKIIILLIPVVMLVTAMKAYAHCPLCTAAVGTAALSAKYYGLDISIIGLLIGAFGVSTGLWLGRRIKRKYFRFQLPVIIILSFLLTVIPLRFINVESFFLPLLYFGDYGTIFNKVYMIDKMLFGSTIGGITTLIAFRLHNYIKNLKGNVLFPFQGIAFTLAFLALSGFLLLIAFS